jgi:phosphatidylinositol alpha-1,6-mannosyltransferase
MLGYVSSEDLRILLNTTDIFVQPNIRVPGDMEGFGIAVIEAGSAGLPVVASDLEGLRDAVIPGENGLLVASEQAEGFIRTINELIRNVDERRLLAARAKETVARNFHWHAIAARYLDVITHTNARS